MKRIRIKRFFTVPVYQHVPAQGSEQEGYRERPREFVPGQIERVYGHEGNFFKVKGGWGELPADGWEWVGGPARRVN